MKKFRLLLCMLSLASVALFTGCDDDDDNGNGRGGGGGGGGNNDVNLAPASLAGRTMNVIVFTGTAPFGTNGTYNIRFDDETTHTLLDESGTKVNTGTYTYAQGSNDDATIVFQDNRGTVTSDLFFDTAVSGVIESSEPGGGFESSDFTLQ